MKRKLMHLALAAAFALPSGLALSQAAPKLSGGSIKIGVLTDLSGVYSDLGGQGSIVATQMAIDDWTAKNKPAYEATIFIGRDPQSSEYRCLWLDNTGPWDFTSQAIGRAKRSGDAIAFRFASNDGSSVNTTFSYNKNADIWQWSIDNETEGKARAFARVSLTRK